jgi:undecaprenyl phosphate-alpha-L-ara4N flippase subunit ArnE
MSPHVFLTITIVLTVASQTLQKQLALDLQRHVHRTNSAFVHYLRQPLFWTALALLGMGLVSWLIVLDAMDVSKAYTLLSINYVLMLPVSRILFAETIPATRWLGVVIIVAGVVCTSWS